MLLIKITKFFWLPEDSSFRIPKDFSQIRMGSSWPKMQNENGVGKICDVQPISHRISVRCRAKVTIKDQWEVIHALSIGTESNDLG